MDFVMMLIKDVSIDTLQFWVMLLIFVFPGYSIKIILDKISLPDKRTYKLQFVDSVYYSALYFICWGLLWKWLIDHKVIEEICFLLILCLIAGTIVIEALIIGAVRYYGFVEWILGLLNFQCGKSIPTAWDYIFSRHQPVFVQITLVDGKVLRGRCDNESFASSECGERDIFLEQGYYINKNDDWKLDNGSDGIYVNGKQIRYIEFRKGGEQDVMG